MFLPFASGAWTDGALMLIFDEGQAVRGEIKLTTEPFLAPYFDVRLLLLSYVLRPQSMASMIRQRRLFH